MNIKEVLDRIEAIVDDYLKNNPYTTNSEMISLTTPSFGKEEIMETIDSLLSTYDTKDKNSINLRTNSLKIFKFNSRF